MVDIRRYLPKALLPMLGALLVLVYILACDISEDQNNFIEQKLLFYYESQNQAWGNHHSKYFIDNQGYVWKGGDSWFQEIEKVGTGSHDLVYYDAKQLEERYADSAKCFVTQINPDELYEIYKLIDKIPNGYYSDRVGRGADMGTRVYGCFCYDDLEDKYRQVILKIDGDWTVSYLSPDAAELVDWLEVKIEQVYNTDPYQKENGTEFWYEADGKSIGDNFSVFSRSSWTVEAVFIESESELGKTVYRFEDSNTGDPMYIMTSTEFDDEIELLPGIKYDLEMQYVWDAESSCYGLKIYENQKMLFQGAAGWEVDHTPFSVDKSTPILSDEAIMNCSEYVNSTEYIFTFEGDTVTLRKGESAVLGDYQIDLYVAKGERLSYTAIKLEPTATGSNLSTRINWD